MKISVENKIRFGYGAAFFLLLIAFSYSVFTTYQLLYHIQSVGRTNIVLHNLEFLLPEMKELGTVFQNEKSVDTTSEAYYTQSFQTADSLCMLLQRETRKGYVAQIRLREIRQQIDNIRFNLLPEIKSNKKNQKEQHQYIIQAQDAMQKAVWRITDMHTSEKALLTLRSQRLYGSSGSVTAINIIILVLALLLAGYSWIIFNRQNAIKKRLDNRAVEYGRELEQKVRELTIVNKELSQLTSMKRYMVTGRIARTIAHEVRNPLTNINLSCAQLKDDVKKNEFAANLLEIIMRNSCRINELVKELLDATMVQELNFENVSMNALLDETLNVARDRIHLEHILVVKDYDPRMSYMKVDVGRIKVAFLNIIINAVEAMDTGGTLTIKTSTKNDECIIQISDNGTGIDKETLDKIFDPYYTSKNAGNGLGLTNAQNIILAHNGTIEVESEPGDGTTFTIMLEYTTSPRSVT